MKPSLHHLLVILYAFIFDVLPKHHVKVVIPSYNNSAFYEKNLTTLIEQKKTSSFDVQVIYLDDCSSDNTATLVEHFVKKHNFEDIFTLIKNPMRCKPARNRYLAVHRYCDDDDIVAFYDGDDYLIDDNALTYITDEYNNPNVWLTYGNSRSTVHGPITWCKPFDKRVIKKKSYRKSPWRTGHMRTCYAWLFKQIKLTDFLYQGAFLEMATDQAYMHPLLEMADGNFKFIQPYIYMHNEHNPINMWHVDKKLQHFLRDVVLARQPYKPLRCKPTPYPKNPTYCIISADTQLVENCDYSVFVNDKQPQHQEIVSVLEQLQKTGAWVAILATRTAQHTKQQLKHCSYLWDTTFTFQLGWQPQLFFDYQPYAWVVATKTYHSNVDTCHHIVNNTLDRDKLTKQLKEEAGLLIITS